MCIRIAPAEQVLSDNTIKFIFPERIEKGPVGNDAFCVAALIPNQVFQSSNPLP